MTSKTSGCDTRPRTSRYSRDQGFFGLAHSTRLVCPVAGNRPILPPGKPRTFRFTGLYCLWDSPEEYFASANALVLSISTHYGFFPTAEPSCSLGTEIGRASCRERV